MSISPLSFREFGLENVEFVSRPKAKPFLPHGARIKEEATPPPPPPPPTYSEDELKAAERDSYQKGFLEGINEGKNQAQNEQADIDKGLTLLVESFSAHYRPMFALYREMLKHQAGLLPQMALQIAKKVAGDALSKNAYAQVEEICLRAMNAVSHEPQLIVTVHESFKATLEAKIRNQGGNIQNIDEIIVVGDASIAPENCRIEWKNGAMVRDTQALWQQVEQLVGSMVASAGSEAEALSSQVESQPVNTDISQGE